MSKDNLNENNITINDNKKSKKKKVIISIIIALVIIIAIVIGFVIKSYAYQYRFEHDSDEINMSNNSITYKYFDNENEVERKKTYAITDEWLHRMIVRNQPLDNDWDSNPIATDTTIYGPYTWIPAGEYIITFDLTDEGGHAFQYWDVGVNFGNGSCGRQNWDASYSQSNPLVVGKNGATIYNSHYWRDSSGPHLQYTIYTTGDTADYEFRLYFSSSLGNDIPFTGTGDMSIKKDFLNSVKIEAETANTISFNADGGTVNGKATGTLTSTYWGKSREKVSVPTKDGYTFMGWYGYSKATNTTSRRSGLTFDKNSEKIKLWNADGTPAIKTEVSYNDYTVYAEWKPNYNLEVNWDSGVSYVKGTDIDGNTITINEGESYEYHYNYAAPTYIYLKEGYAVDYITETSDNNHKWTDTTKNDTLGRWENRWTMNKDRTIYIHTKIADDYCSLTLNGDEGVEKIEGFTKGETKLYKKGTKVTYKFKVKDGYELDYISEGNAHYSAIKLDNDKDGYNYSDYYNINGNRSGYIHTKPASYTLTIDPNGGTMYNGNAKTSSVYTTKFLYGRKTYIGNSYTNKYGYLNYENNTPTKEGYTFAGWKFSNGTGGLNSDGSEFFFGDIAADEDTTYDDDDIYIFNGNYTGDVTATAQWIKGSYQQNVYVRYQNEDGSWGDYSDKYWHISTDEAPNGYWEYFRWTINSGAIFWFGLDDIKQDSKWDDTLYEFPDTFADGSSLSYTVTGESKKYVDIKRKQHTINFNKGLTNSTATMPDVAKLAGDTYKIPLPKWLGRSYVITLDNDGSKTTINGNLSFDQWKGYQNIPFNEIKKDDTRYDWYSDGELLENIRYDMTFVANWESEDVTLPTPTKEGYAFTGWYEDKALTKKVNGTTYKVEPDTTPLDVTLYAKWTAQTASYTVKHHYMDVNGKYSDGTGLLETETLTAQTGSNVTPKIKARTGFTSPKTQTVTVKADGTTVVDYYYARNKYSITYKKGNTDSTQTDVTDNATYDSNYTMKAANTFTGRTYNVKYDKGYTTNRDWEKTTLPSNITNAHLTFKNWSIERTTKNAGDTFKYTYAKNVTATANWNAASIKLTSVERTGYTFAGWKCSVDGKIYKAGDAYTINEGTSKLDVTFTATWTANTNTKYVVKHWKQNINSDASKHNSTNYTLADTDNFTGTTDTIVRPSVKNYEGFTAPNVQTVQIKPDGSLVVNYYYTRNSYTLTVDPKDTTWTDGNKVYTNPVKFTLQYEETKSIADPVKTGYHLKNWSINPNTSGAAISGKTFKMGYGNVTISPVMEANTITVNYNANGGDSSKNFSITEKYDNNFTIYNNAKIKYYDATRTPFTRTDCRFTGWKSNSGKAYTSNWKGILNTANGFPASGSITFYAQWETDVQIQIYEQYVFKGTNDIAGVSKGYAGTNHNDNNDYYLADSFTKVSNVDTTFTYTPTARTGFTTPSAVTINVTSGKPVINVYYDRKSYNISDPKKPSGDDKDPRDDDSSLVKGGNSINVWLGAGIDSVNGVNAKKTYKYGEPVSLTANIKSGYHWHSDGDCDTDISTHPTGWIVKNVQSYNADKNKLTFNMPANDVSISVRATNNSYYVNFVIKKPSSASHDIQGRMDRETIIYDEAKLLTKNSYSLVGWTFAGWVSDNNKTYKDGATVKNLTATNKGTVNLYTTWTANIYNIKFDANTPSTSNGYDKDTAASTTAKVDYSNTKYTFDSKIDKMPNATLEGWKFDGWYTEPGKGKGTKLTTENTYTIPKDTTLYAHYTANTYNLRYEANNGTSDSFTETVTYDKTYKTAQNRYTKTGYSFIGWKSDVTNNWAKLSNTISDGWFKHSDKEDVSIWTQNTGWYKNSVIYWTGKYNKANGRLLGPDTLKAQWRANNYTITFNYDTYKDLYKSDSSLNDYIKLVKNGPDTMVVQYDSEVGTLPGPVVTGTKFIGWFDSKTGGKQYNPDTTYKEAKEITLYARYEQLTGTFTYKSNGITYNNNGLGEYKNVDVKDPDDYDVMTDYVTLSENKFGKIADKNSNEYLITDNEYKRIELKEGSSYISVVNTAEDDYYTFQGWSAYPYARKVTDSDAKLIHNAGYKDKFFMFAYENLAVKNELGTIGDIDAKTLRNINVETGKSNENKIRNAVNNLIADKNLSSGQTDVTLYAIWDKYPEITSETMTIPSNYLDNYLSNGSYNNTAKSELVKYIRNQKLSATDREDGDITGSIEFEENAVDLIIDQFLTMKKTTGLTTRNVKVPVSVTDSVGNKAYDYIDLWINSVDPINKKEPDIIDPNEEYKGQLLTNNVRVISEEYYNTYNNADYSLETYKDYGGLMPYSLWYTDENYKNVITDCFNNFKNRTPEQTWYFTHDEVLEVQNFIEENGFGNSKKEANKENPLTTFYNTFKKTIKTQ